MRGEISSAFALTEPFLAGADPTRIATTATLDGDDSDPDYHFNVGYALWKNRSFDVAAERFRSVLDRVPTDRESITMLGRCLKKEGPRPGDARTEGLERIKKDYEESAFLQLKSMIEKQ